MKKAAIATLTVTICALTPTAHAQQQARYTELGALPPIDAQEIAVSPNGRVIMVGDGRSLYAFDRTTRTATQVGTGGFHDVTWSPRGDRLAFFRDHDTWGTTPIWIVPVDPTSGKLTGPPRRVTDRSGDEPVFSPDGRQIAFSMDTDRRGQDLGIVPAAGGPVRSVYQSAPGVSSITWAPDGKSISFEADLPGGHALLRVPSTGGKAEVLSHNGEAWPGVEPGARWFLDQSAGGSYRVVGTDGRELAAGLRIPPDLGNRKWSPNGRALIALRVVRPSKLVHLPLGGGAARAVTSGATGDNWPSWSPNGQQLAVVRTAEGRTWLAVLGPDGTVRSEFKKAPAPDPRPPVWSPDGQRLAYSSRSSTSMTVLDVATGVAQDVATRQIDVSWYHWRDASTIRYFTWTTGSERRGEIRDATTTGEPRLVKDLGPDSVAGGGLVRGNIVVFGLGTRKPSLLDLSSGKTQPLTIGKGSAPDLSPDGKFLVLPQRGGPNELHIYDIDHSTGRTIPLPFTVVPTEPAAFWHPDGRHVIVAGVSPGTDRTRVFLVPVNGEPATTLATLARRQEAIALAIAPDGKSLVYAEEGPPAASIGELSLDDILPRSGAAPSAKRP